MRAPHAGDRGLRINIIHEFNLKYVHAQTLPAAMHAFFTILSVVLAFCAPWLLPYPIMSLIGVWSCFWRSMSKYSKTAMAQEVEASVRDTVPNAFAIDLREMQVRSVHSCTASDCGTC